MARECYEGQEQYAQMLRTAELERQEIETRANEEIYELKRIAELENEKRNQAANNAVETARQTAQREYDNATQALVNLKNDEVMQQYQEFAFKYQNAIEEEGGPKRQ